MSMKTEMTRIFAGLKKADKKMALELEQPARGRMALAQERFTKRVRVKAWNVDGFPGVTINGSYAKAAHILMLPGGAYTLEPSDCYREMAEQFAIERQVKVTIPSCPLAPEYTALDVHRYLVRVYSWLASEYPEDEFFLFGDFSGGGLALSFLQELRDMGNLPMPVRTAVVSPWLDIALNNPKIKIMKKNRSHPSCGRAERGRCPLLRSFGTGSSLCFSPLWELGSSGTDSGIFRDRRDSYAGLRAFGGKGGKIAGNGNHL